MSTRTFTDQMGRSVDIPYPPRRIISLVPSQTELLCDLGLSELVIGITKFCIHPAGVFKSVRKIGGTKNLDLKTIRELKPDLIIGNKEENEQGQVEELMREFTVWMSDITTLGHALKMIRQIGELTATGEKAASLASKIAGDFRSLEVNPKELSVAYFIWKEPYMIAGRDTFIDDILKRAGLSNISGESRYPQVTISELEELQPDIILLSSEPYPFKDVHVKEIGGFCPKAITMVVDGEMFSWYGSRLLRAPAYIRALTEKINSFY